jgi:hypothetical protein
MQLVTVIQANLPPEDAPVGTSYVMFTQYFGGAVFISIARTVLTSSLGSTVREDAPTVDPALVIGSGVTELRDSFPASVLDGVILAYNKSLVSVWYVQVALACAAFVCSWFSGWKDIRKEKKEQQDCENGSGS